MAPENDDLSKPCTAFDGARILAAGPLNEVALAVKAALERDDSKAVLTFDDATGRVIDFDLRGTTQDVLARLTPSETRGRGRPKLGVIGREVTLLPRHWEWLAAQPGGASVALRKLIDEARRSDTQHMRAAQEAAYRFMSAMAGNLAGFEEAARALFARNRAAFEQQTSTWPDDVRAYALKLAAFQ